MRIIKDKSNLKLRVLMLSLLLVPLAAGATGSGVTQIQLTPTTLSKAQKVYAEIFSSSAASPDKQIVGQIDPSTGIVSFNTDELTDTLAQAVPQDFYPFYSNPPSLTLSSQVNCLSKGGSTSTQYPYEIANFLVEDQDGTVSNLQIAGSNSVNQEKTIATTPLGPVNAAEVINHQYDIVFSSKPIAKGYAMSCAVNETARPGQVTIAPNEGKPFIAAGINIMGQEVSQTPQGLPAGLSIVTASDIQNAVRLSLSSSEMGNSQVAWTQYSNQQTYIPFQGIPVMQVQGQ